jgi:hypothetical protein
VVTLDDLIDAIGVDAARFALVQRSHDQTIDLDLELLTQQNAENPVFYCQYAHARICSILAKAGEGAEAALPQTGWLVEDPSPVAMQWSDDWIARNGGQRFASRQQLQDALRTRRVEAGVIVLEGWIGPASLPRADRIELWLSNRIHPGAAGRLRSEISFSMLQLQIKNRVAAAGPLASVLLNDTKEGGLASPLASPNIRYLYEIESGRKMTAVQQSVPAWLIFGMFFVVIPLAGVLIQERNDGTLARIATFGASPLTILGGKLAAFMALNWVQLLLMLLVGRWLVPLLGGDTLYLDLQPGWFLLMVFATSAAAVVHSAARCIASTRPCNDANTASAAQNDGSSGVIGDCSVAKKSVTSGSDSMRSSCSGWIMRSRTTRLPANSSPISIRMSRARRAGKMLTSSSVTAVPIATGMITKGTTASGAVT